MKIGILFFLAFINLTVNASEIDIVNKVLLYKKIQFIQNSVNEMTGITSESSGFIERDGEIISINIQKPFDEKYIINETQIKIIDNDFDQESTIEISTLPNKDLIKLIKSGFEEKDVLKISKTSYQLKDSQKPILIRDIADNSFSLIYLDNLDVLNTIIFMVKV